MGVGGWMRVYLKFTLDVKHKVYVAQNHESNNYESTLTTLSTVSKKKKVTFTNHIDSLSPIVKA